MEKKAASKGGKKAEKLLKKAASKRENAQIKAEERVNKITDKFDSKKRKIEDKKNVKVAKNEVKKLKAQGASKSDIEAAKKSLKNAKKVRKEHKKEDGRGVARKAWKGLKKGSMLPVRSAFLALLNINFRGLAKRLHDNKEAFGKFDKKWRNVFGGKTSKLKIAVNKGSYKKALFGQSKKGKVNGLYSQLAALGAEPVEMTAGAWVALASSALTAVVAILKSCGVNVPESLDEAIAAGENAAAILDGDMVSEDPDNYEDGSDSDDFIDGKSVAQKLVIDNSELVNNEIDEEKLVIDNSELVNNEIDEEKFVVDDSELVNNEVDEEKFVVDDSAKKIAKTSTINTATSKGRSVKKDDSFFKKHKTPIILSGIAVLAVSSILIINKNK